MTRGQQPKVLAFDVFGTVVDWFGTISSEVARKIPEVDSDAFARAWRDGYQPAMDRVRSGELAWTKIDNLHRLILDEVLTDFRVDWIDEATKAELNFAWHRLDPWPDSAEGLIRLKSQFTICTLSNGNLSLLADMSKHGHLPWDLILSAENFGAYKPDEATYLGVCDVFSIDPGELMMIAAHPLDLDAARACGCRTAFIHRPLEYGPGQAHDPGPTDNVDLSCDDLIDLANQLGA